MAGHLDHRSLGRQAAPQDHQPAGRLERLAQRADILVENFRPGTLDALGLGYADLSANHPELIYCSISGYGQTGPDRERGGYDLVAQGAAGLIVRADDPDHFSAFLISGDGYFRVSDYRSGAWIDRAAWRAWPHIRRDGAANVLRAECQPDRCTFFVNDEWTWQERALPAAHEVGVIADAQAAREPLEAQFDQVGEHP